MAVKLVLKVYCYNTVTKKYEYMNEDLDFISGVPADLLPRSITKDIKKVWRLGPRGRKQLRRAKYYNREYLKFALSGGCDEVLRRKIEFFCKKNAKFLVKMDNDTAKVFRTPRSPTDCGTFASYGETYDTLFVICTSLRFTMMEGKIGFYEYKLELERVSCEDITDPAGGSYDKWTCNYTPP